MNAIATSPQPTTAKHTLSSSPSPPQTSHLRALSISPFFTVVGCTSMVAQLSPLQISRMTHWTSTATIWKGRAQDVGSVYVLVGRQGRNCNA